jgi:hypothetical protein
MRPGVIKAVRVPTHEQRWIQLAEGGVECRLEQRP